MKALGRGKEDLRKSLKNFQLHPPSIATAIHNIVLYCTSYHTLQNSPVKLFFGWGVWFLILLIFVNLLESMRGRKMRCMFFKIKEISITLSILYSKFLQLFFNYHFLGAPLFTSCRHLQECLLPVGKDNLSHNYACTN